MADAQSPEALTSYAQWEAPVPDVIYEAILTAWGDFGDACADEDWSETKENAAGLALQRSIDAALAFVLHVGTIEPAPVPPKIKSARIAGRLQGRLPSLARAVGETDHG